eukprot:9264766-Pyramimonas_sp.AAC.1
MNVRNDIHSILNDHDGVHSFKRVFQCGQGPSDAMIQMLKEQVQEWVNGSIDTIMKEHTDAVIQKGPSSIS